MSTRSWVFSRPKVHAIPIYKLPYLPVGGGKQLFQFGDTLPQVRIVPLQGCAAGSFGAGHPASPLASWFGSLLVLVLAYRRRLRDDFPSTQQSY